MHRLGRLKRTGAGWRCRTYNKHLAAHTYQHSFPQGPVKTHPCSAALTRSRMILLYSDKQSLLYNCEFLSRIHQYLLIDENTKL